MMECHCELEFLETVFEFLLYKFILDGDNFEHFLHMVDKFLKITISLNDLIDRECHTANSLASQIKRNLIFLRDEIRNIDQIAETLHIVNDQFILHSESKMYFG